MTSQVDLAPSVRSHRCNGRPKSCLVSLRVSSRRWPMRARLAEGKVTTEHCDPRGAESIRQCCEKQRATVCSGAMSQDQTVCPRKSRAVQESSNGCILSGRVDEFVKVLHRHPANQLGLIHLAMPKYEPVETPHPRISWKGSSTHAISLRSILLACLNSPISSRPSSVNLRKAFGGVFLQPDFSCGNRSPTRNQYANVFLHPVLHYGFGGARAQVPRNVDSRPQVDAA
jgi:hypothetical protein